MLKKFAPILGFLLINLIYYTCRKKYFFEKIPDRNAIFLFWHGEILMLNKITSHLHTNFKKTAIVISEHKDGEIIAQIASKFGFDTIRGSTSKGAIKALKQMIKRARLGYNIAITPDGPRGPRHEIVADGAIYLAQKLKMPVICFNIKASRAFRANSWDRFAIPYPFSTLEYYISKPIELHDMELEPAKELLKKELLKNAF